MDLTFEWFILCLSRDAYFELYVRKYILGKGITKVNELHKKAISYTSSKAQAKMIAHFVENNILSKEELDAFKHGRNGAHFGRKNVDGFTYQQATGFESLIGYLSQQMKQDVSN